MKHGEVFARYHALEALSQMVGSEIRCIKINFMSSMWDYQFSKSR